MSSQAVARLAKPKLRGYLRSYIQRHMAIAGVLAVASGMAWKYGVAEPRKKKYAEFYKTYDPIKEYQRIEALGGYDEIGMIKRDAY